MVCDVRAAGALAVRGTPSTLGIPIPAARAVMLCTARLYEIAIVSCRHPVAVASWPGICIFIAVVAPPAISTGATKIGVVYVMPWDRCAKLIYVPVPLFPIVIVCSAHESRVERVVEDPRPGPPSASVLHTIGFTPF